jgi:hypothetical protein
VLLIRCYSEDKINKNEMGSACGMYGRGEGCKGIEGYLTKRDQREDLGLDGNMAL